MSGGPPPADLPDNYTLESRLAESLGSEPAHYWLSAIIESADDAVISKPLEGVITKQPVCTENDTFRRHGISEESLSEPFIAEPVSSIVRVNLNLIN